MELIDKYYRTHAAILKTIHTMRVLSQRGVEENADEIARLVLFMHDQTAAHLRSEDEELYPQLARSSDPRLAAMSEQYQREMRGLKEAFEAFVSRWQEVDTVTRHPEEFRDDANHVLHALFDRINKENTEFYPVIYQTLTAEDQAQ